ncbi:CU044_5270 family protein [Lentzea sp. NBC_00516]|uniref:CU044_5270 family protein n=1 Tax=Lentzea sp. NBC_00516 TaxID=2903582 RepID=UPI002E8144CD|nr:CU044_5270 family protein [Lentzea sp. NBC_00516]WUD28488.1 CU044_5270 family protein [Lentzea sp. NBC_00516]
MDDLQLVRELDETPLKSADQLSAARAQFVAGMKPPRRGRAGVIAVATIAVAAAAAGVALVLPSGSPDPADHDTASPAVESAVQLLNHAAAAARSKPDVVPRPDQLYYVRTGEREDWFSVDGTHDGQMILAGNTPPIPVPGCVDGRRKVLDKYDQPTGGTEECTPDRAYRDDLPTTADEMLKVLQGDEKDRPVNSYGKDVLSLVFDSYLPGPQRAALFEAATRVPGLTVVENVSSGRPGIGISWPVPEGSLPSAQPVVMVFDKDTYEYLGTKNRPQDASGFVDQVGDRI